MAGKLKQNPSISNDISYEVASVTEGFMASEPYLHITNSLALLTKKRRIPVLLSNFSNKTIRLKRGCIIGQLRPIDQCVSVTTAKTDHSARLVQNICSLDRDITHDTEHGLHETSNQFRAPLEYNENLDKLITKIQFVIFTIL